MEFKRLFGWGGRNSRRRFARRGRGISKKFLSPFVIRRTPNCARSNVGGTRLQWGRKDRRSAVLYRCRGGARSWQKMCGVLNLNRPFQDKILCGVSVKIAAGFGRFLRIGFIFAEPNLPPSPTAECP
ncbi:MAG: hypothetical protein DBX55_04820 [Verrucomicrobia bacterium]|nr:MAG: hypothetical protein DBX55_04820 [Verrucomicrobiota bacterium]